MEVRLEYLHPWEIEEAMAGCPVLYLPLGTIEWHGRQNVVGLDALKAHRLCVRAAEMGGGLVAPAVYGGLGGLQEPFTFVVEQETLMSTVLRPWLERLCSEAVRSGFRAVIMLTGHYGAEQQIVVRETAVRMTRLLNRPILGTPEYFLALDLGYTGDHAAFFETSLMMDLYPGSVDLGQLGEPPHQGVYGDDPLKATKEAGSIYNEAIVSRMAALAGQMPDWDDVTVDAFANAEAALATRQIVLAGRANQVWEGWRSIITGAFAEYPVKLVGGDFAGIEALVKKL
jgi:creatinine amidohydrolase